MKLKALFNVGGHLIGKPGQDIRRDEIVDVPNEVAEKLLAKRTPFFTKDVEPKEAAPEKGADGKIKTTRSPVLVDSNKNKDPAHFGLRGSVSKEDGEKLPDPKLAQKQPISKPSL